MEFLVMGRYEIERLTRATQYGVISFFDPGALPPSLLDDQMRINSTFLSVFDYAVIDDTDPKDFRIFLGSDAAQILDFIENLYEHNVTTCVVQCERGVSRSRGCALALSLIYGQSEEHQCLGMPNALVVYRILKEYQVRHNLVIKVPPIIRKTRYVNGTRVLNPIEYDLLSGVNDLLKPIS